MPTTVVVEFFVKAEHAAEFKQMLKEALPDTRAHEGCLGLKAHNNLDRDGDLVIVQQWQSRAHYEKYLNWRMESGMMESIGPLLESDPKIRFLDTIIAL